MGRYEAGIDLKTAIVENPFASGRADRKRGRGSRGIAATLGSAEEESALVIHFGEAGGRKRAVRSALEAVDRVIAAAGEPSFLWRSGREDRRLRSAATGKQCRHGPDAKGVSRGPQLWRPAKADLRCAAFFTGAVAVNDAPLRQVVGRQLDVDSVAGKNPDAVTAQPAGDVSENHVAVLELDGKGRAGENLLDVTDDFDRTLFGIFGGVGLGLPRGRPAGSATDGYCRYSFETLEVRFACGFSHRNAYRRNLPPSCDPGSGKQRRARLARSPFLPFVRRGALVRRGAVGRSPSGRPAVLLVTAIGLR